MADAMDRRPAGKRGFGVVGSLPHEVVREVAWAAEAAGYRTFWANDGPAGEGLAALRAAAEATQTIRLGVGAIPLDRQPPERIAARIAELDLPLDRLTIGIGAGDGPGGVERVRDGVLTLRRLIAAPVVVAALGPMMRRLAGEIADGVLLDWVTPAYARLSAAETERAAEAAGRPQPRIAAYVFTALGAAAGERLRAEAAYYGALPAYAANLQRMEATALESAVGGETPAEIRRGLGAFATALDETVVRATVAEETAAAYLAVLAAAVPAT